MKKTWFITGASRGFGRIWAEAALTRGDQVTATARNLADVADLTERFGTNASPGKRASPQKVFADEIADEARSSGEAQPPCQ